MSEGLPPGREDPGPPPARGLVVRPLQDGYYVRIWPRPAVPLLRMAATGVVSAALGAAIGWWFAADEPFLVLTIVISSVVFIGLLGLFAFGSGFMPVEIVVSSEVVNWDGERHPLGVIEDCTVVRDRLELRARGGRVLGHVDHVPPDVGRWVSLAVRASLPEPS